MALLTLNNLILVGNVPVRPLLPCLLLYSPDDDRSTSRCASFVSGGRIGIEAFNNSCRAFNIMLYVCDVIHVSGVAGTYFDKFKYVPGIPVTVCQV